MAKIVVVGDYNLDFVLYLDRFPTRGETLKGRKFFEGPGGTGSNQAIGAARLGADVTFFGAVGQDNYGDAALRTWEAEGVRVDKVVRSDEEDTAVAMIYVDSSNGDNMVAVTPGANQILQPQHLEEIVGDIAEADLLLCTLGLPLPVVRRALHIADKAAVPTVLNPSPARSIPADILALSRYFTPNDRELEIIARAGASSITLESARHIFQRDDQTMIVPQGEAGSSWVTRTEMQTIPSFETDVKDTVGAGDAFNAGFAVALAERQSLSDAVRFGNATAALSITQVGAVAGMPQRADVDALIAGG